MELKYLLKHPGFSHMQLCRVLHNTWISHRHTHTRIPGSTNLFVFLFALLFFIAANNTHNNIKDLLFVCRSYRFRNVVCDTALTLRLFSHNELDPWAPEITTEITSSRNQTVVLLWWNFTISVYNHMTLEDSLSVTEGMLTAYWKTDTQSYIYQHKKRVHGG